MRYYGQVAHSDRNNPVLDDASKTVSVVIPTIRGGRYLNEAVTSALSQRGADIEIVIVTNRDGVDLSQLPCTSQIIVVDEPVPVKAFALNRGVLNASGKWIAFLDDDDVWFDGKIDKQLKALASWSGSPACTTNSVVMDSNSVTGSVAKNAALTYGSLLKGKIEFLFSSLIVDREFLIQRGLIDGSYRRADDYEVFLRIARSGPLAYVPEPLVGYRIHGSNTVSGDFERFKLESLRALADNRRLARIDHKWSSFGLSLRGTVSMRRAWSWAMLGRAHELFRQGNLKEAGKEMGRAIGTFPLVVIERLVSAEPIKLTRASKK